MKHRVLSISIALLIYILIGLAIIGTVAIGVVIRNPQLDECLRTDIQVTIP